MRGRIVIIPPPLLQHVFVPNTKALEDVGDSDGIFAAVDFKHLVISERKTKQNRSTFLPGNVG